MKQLFCRLLPLVWFAVFEAQATGIELSCKAMEAEEIEQGKTETHRCADTRKFEVGFQRLQRVDRDEGDGRLQAFDNSAFLYYRSNAVSLLSYGGEDCNEPDLLEPCSRKPTFDWEAAVDFDPHGGSADRALVRASIYFPLTLDEQSQGIYNPYSPRAVALGASLQGTRLIDADTNRLPPDADDDLSEFDASVFLTVKCWYADGECAAKEDSKTFDWDIEARYSVINADDNDADRRVSSLRAESVFWKSQRLEHVFRAYYLDTHDNDQLDSERAGLEYGVSVCLSGCDENNVKEMSRWQTRFDLLVGHEDLNGNGLDASSIYLRPTIYVRWTPGLDGDDGPYGFGSGWGSWFTWP